MSTRQSVPFLAVLPKLEAALDGQLIQLRHVALAQPPAQGSHIGFRLWKAGARSEACQFENAIRVEGSLAGPFIRVTTHSLSATQSKATLPSTVPRTWAWLLAPGMGTAPLQISQLRATCAGVLPPCACPRAVSRSTIG